MAGVTIEETGLRFVELCMKNYWGGCLFLALFMAGILSSIVCYAGEKITGKGKGKKALHPSSVMVWMTVILFCTVYNPYLVRWIIPRLNFENEYYRFFWILPVIPGTAYYLVRLIFIFRSGFLRVGAAFLAAVLLIELGTPLEGVVTNFAPVENIYKVPDGLVEACAIIHEDSDEEHPRVVFDKELNIMARQYDPSLSLVLGRDAVLYRDGSQVVTVDPTRLVYRRQKVIMDRLYFGEKIKRYRFKRALIKTRTDYLVLKKGAGGRRFLKRAGCRVIGRSGDYLVYRFEA